MNSRALISCTAWARWFGRVACLLPLMAFALALLSKPNLRAEEDIPFTYVTNQNAITITGYSGAGGAVTIPSELDGLPVTAIGYEAFRNRADLTRITLPEGVTTIGALAFFYCTGLTQIGLPDSLTSIGDVAFAYCTRLTQISLPDSLTSIGDHAFYECGSLTQITFPRGLATIGEGAFAECRKLAFARFLGNAPEIVRFGQPLPPTFPWGTPIFYLPSATGWNTQFYGGGLTSLWLPAIRWPAGVGGLPGGSFGFLVEWSPQSQVTIEACADLAHLDWQPVGVLTLDSSGTALFSDPDSARHAARLYRLRTP